MQEIIVDGVLKQVFSINGSSYVVPSGVHTIDGDAFVRLRCKLGFKKLIVSEGVETICSGAFAGLSKLEILSLPSTLKVMEGGVFSNNTNLTIIKCKAKKIDFVGNPFAGLGNEHEYYPTNDPRNIIILGDTLFKYYGNDRLLALPNGITRIWTGAFKDNRAITQIVMSSSVNDIMPGAFENCPNLREVLVNDINKVSVHKDAFINCNRVHGLSTDSSLGEVATYEDISPRLNVLINSRNYNVKSNSFPDMLRKTMSAVSDDLETAAKGTDINSVVYIYNQNGYVEQTARVLMITGRYSSVADTRKLLDAGFNFNYKPGYTSKPDYFQMNRHGINASDTPYYLGVIPQYVGYYDVDGILSGAFHYTGNGVNVNNFPLPLANRLALVDVYLESPLKYGVSKDLMLWFAISRGEFVIAERLMERGVDLNSDVPYFCPNIDENRTIIEILASKDFNGYHRRFIEDLAELNSEEDLFRAIKLLVSIAARFDKKIVFNQSALTKFKFTELPTELIEYLVNETVLVGVSKKKMLETMLLESKNESFMLLVGKGWISSPDVRDELIEKAREYNLIEMTTWLLDYKFQTADEALEEERAAKRFMREIMADPSEPFIIRKNWCYRKKDDGTIKITNYKGNETDVTVPSKVGDAIVTEIGYKCFSPTSSRVANAASRKEIRSISIPDSVTCIGDRAFYGCTSLTHVTLSNGLIKLGEIAFGHCVELAGIDLPDSLSEISLGAFYQCKNLRQVEMPANLKKICSNAFSFCGFEVFTIPPTLKSIGYSILDHNKKLESLIVHSNCDFILRGQCQGCTELKDIYIGDQTGFEVGAFIFGISNDYTIHTNHLSRAASELAAMSAKNGVKVEFDYYP